VGRKYLGPCVGIFTEGFHPDQRLVLLHFNSLEDVEEVLNKLWVVNNDSLMLKRWHCAFNPDKEVI